MRRSVARRPFSRCGVLGGRYLLASSRRSAWSVQHVTPRWLSGVAPLVSGSCRWAGGMEGPLEDEHDLALHALPEAGDHESLGKPPSIRGVRIEAASSSVGSNAPEKVLSRWVWILYSNVGIPFVELREGAGSRDVPLKDEPGFGGDRRISINQAPVEPTT
jgi:hypothetical protein